MASRVTRRTAITKAKKPSTALTGAAGEHYVLYRLLRLNLCAGLPPAGTPDVDLLIVDEGAAVITSLQVKTRTTGADGGWHMKVKHETLRSPRLFYVFVDFQPEHPVCFVIPSPVVAEVVGRSHAAWLRTPGRGGRRHAQTDMRRVLPRYPFEVEGFASGWMDEYRERWELLGKN